MKKLIVLLFPFLLASCSVMGVYPDAEKYVAGSQDYEGEIKTLNVSWVAGSLTLVEDESATTISVKEDNSLSEAEKVHSYFHDNTLDVQYCASGFVGHIDSNQKNLVITYKPGLEKLNISLTSGSFRAEALHASEANLSLTSGKIEVNNIEASEINCSSTSGSISFNDVKTNKFKSSFTSGSSTVNFLELNEAHLSGTSGYIVLRTPEVGATVHVSQTSGKTNSHREGTVSNGTYTYGDGSAKVDISLTSGTVELY